MARAAGTAGAFGAFLDSVLDRYSEAVVFVGLIVWYSREGDTLAVTVSALAMAGSFMVSYCRARAEGLGLDCEVGLLQRPERIVVLGIGLMLAELVYPMVLVAEPGVMFSDPPRDDEIGLLGNHGGTGEEWIPLVLCGGARFLDTRHDRAKLTEAHPSAADVGATIAALLGLRPPRRLDGRPIEAANRGQVLGTVRVP